MTSGGENQVPPKIRAVVYYAVPTGADTLQIRTSSKTTILRGATVREVFPLLLPLLDGSSTEAEVIAKLAGKVEARKVSSVLKALRDRALLEDVIVPPADIFPDPGEYASLARCFGAQAARPYDLLAALRRAHVLVVNHTSVATRLPGMLAHLGFGRVTLLDSGTVSETDALTEPGFEPTDVGQPRSAVAVKRIRISKSGVAFAAESELPVGAEAWQRRLVGVSFAVLVLEGPAALQLWLGDFNRAALDESVPWTSFAALETGAIQIGPTVVPAITACHACLTGQLDAQLAFLKPHTPFAEGLKRSASAPPSSAIRELGESALAVEVARAVGSGQEALSYGKIITLDASSFETTFHTVPKVPRCAACGPARNSPKMRVWS